MSTKTPPMVTLMTRWVAPVVLALILPVVVQAAVFDGGGVFAGLGAASGITGVAQGDLPSFVRDVLARAVTYATLLGVIVVVAAGFMLILGFGDDSAKERAKKAIIYTCVGLLVLYFAQVIVDFFATAGGSDVRGPIEAMMVKVSFYLTLLGVVVVFCAGVYLIASFGSDEAKERAKKMIYYTLAGLLVVFFARVIVVFTLSLPAVG